MEAVVAVVLKVAMSMTENQTVENQKVGIAEGGAEIKVGNAIERAEIPVEIETGTEIGSDAGAAEMMREGAVAQGAAEVVASETEARTEESEVEVRKDVGGLGAEVEIEGGKEKIGSLIRVAVLRQ